MGISFVETWVTIWNKFIRRRQDAIKKRNKQKKLSRKHKERNKSGKAAKAGGRYCILAKKTIEQERE